MKNPVSLFNKAAYKVAALLVMLQGIMFSVVSYAQDGGGDGDKKIDVNVGVDNGGGAWYNNWWIWAIVVMIFIIIIVAITNRGRSNKTDA